jgi:GTPase SAR1 family protein
MNYILHALSFPFVYFNRRSQRVTNNARTAKTNYKVVLVGDTLSGKSCLLMSFLHNQFNPNHIAACGEMSYTKTIQIDGKSVSKWTRIFFSYNSRI